MMSNVTGVLVNDLSSPAKGHDGGFKRPFNPEFLRLADEYDDEPRTQSLILDIPVHKPPATAFIRTHPEYQAKVGILELSETREHFLVTRAMYGQLIKEKAVSKRLLVPSITLQGYLFLWPLKTTRGNRRNRWNASAKAAAEKAKENWVRIETDQELKVYTAKKAVDEHSEPLWPEMTFQEILSVAFRDKIIRIPNHKVLRYLRGER